VTIVWLTLAAYSFGLLASTTTRVYQSAFFALHDTKTPARVAATRVLISAITGAVLMLQFEPISFAGLSIPAGLLRDVRIAEAPLGPIGLALGATVGAWLEWTLLHASLVRRIGGCGAGASRLVRMLVAALAAAVAGYGVRVAAAGIHPLLAAVLVAAAFGTVYLVAARMLGLAEATALGEALARRVRQRRD
jgi:putative peptidoglycan lipid II flippase